MAEIDNGGPAFGQVVELRCVRVGMDGSEEYEPALAQGGMSLRDYFAAKAMHGMAGSRRYCEAGWDQADMASQAYEIADAMLKAREVKHEQG